MGNVVEVDLEKKSQRALPFMHPSPETNCPQLPCLFFVRSKSSGSMGAKTTKQASKQMDATKSTISFRDYIVSLRGQALQMAAKAHH